MSKTGHYNILILGGGFAGVYCGKQLAAHARQDDGFKVALVSSENYMVFQPMLPEVAAASISPRHVVNPIRQLCRGCDVFQGKVTKINPEEKEVRVSPGAFSPDRWLSYNELVLTLGARVDLSRVPGMSEHSLLIQNVGDAMKLRVTVLQRFEEANWEPDKEKRKQLLNFVVVGGGYSGVETAGSLLDMMQEINHYYRHVDEDDFSLTLIHGGDHLLPTLSRKLGDYCEDKLRRRGLNILMKKRVKAVTANTVILESGEQLPTNTVISTVGNAPHEMILKLAEDLNLETERGRLKTGPDLAIPGQDGLWAAGDCAAVPLPDGRTSPPTAQFAQRQGELLGRNLLARYRGKETTAFNFKGLGELAAIGHRTAVGTVLGVNFSGFLAWWMWRSVYVGKLPGLQRKLRVIIDWTFDLFFPRDINLLSPQYSKPLKQMHLEEGDILFNAGEPAFSIYFIQEGAITLYDAGKAVRTLQKGESFGERALLNDQRWKYSAKAARKTKLVGLAAPEFKEIVGASSALQELFERSARTY